MHRPLVPCIWLDDQAEAAAASYVAAFPAGRVTATSRYPDPNRAGKPPGSVMTVDFELAGQRLTALNGGPMFTLNPSISLFAHQDTDAEATALFARLADGGRVLMPLGAYPWSPCYGWVTDRFGLSWQVMAGRRPASGATIAPCLMFSDGRHGRAEEAIRRYVEIFPDSAVGDLARYGEGEGDAPVGTIKHGRFTLAGHDLVAMDSHVNHGFGFNEALSFQVRCDDQAEVDRYRDALVDGGELSHGGWLKDRFGVWWQVVKC